MKENGHRHECGHLSTMRRCVRRSFLVRCSSMRASTRHSMKCERYWPRPSDGSHSLPTHSWFMSPKASVARAAFGADGDVRFTISCKDSTN